MADTFFGFNTSLSNGEHLLAPDEDDCLENEEEYDAYNDETFGALEDSSELDDWEQQHEQFAEIAASSRHAEHIESSFRDLVLSRDTVDSISLTKDSVWSYTPSDKNGGLRDNAILSSLQKASKSFIESHLELDKSTVFEKNCEAQFSLSPPPSESHIKKICTLEEVEKNLIKNSKSQQYQHQQRPFLPPGILPPFHPLFRHPHVTNNRLSSGMPPIGVPPPMRNLPPPHLIHQNIPPGFRMAPPHPFMHANGPMRPPNNMPFPHHINHPYNNYPHPHHYQRNATNQCNQMIRHPQSNQPHQQRIRRDSNNYRFNNNSAPSPDISKDEYDGLMTPREKQWLLNIQMLQLNTGTPYFDDYYYTVFKERKAKINNRENIPCDIYKFQSNRQRNERQENSNPLTPRIYTPLQFENSLGKLQCGSVTAPRKIIDTDVVTCDKESESSSTSRDTRKTKQLLLELEALYTLLLKAEDLTNPMAISNLKTLRDIKQKQRIRELDLATTPEQKQEVLDLFKKESEPPVENQSDYIAKIVNGFLQEDKIMSFLNIRKGKVLLLRLLPHLNPDVHLTHLLEIWSKVFLSLPVSGRRDTLGDNLLPKLHPFFKRFVQIAAMSDILEMVSGLKETIKPDNNRSTPFSHHGKPPLHFVLSNKFGVSALATLWVRAEFLMSSDMTVEKEDRDWSDFVNKWAELTNSVAKVAAPSEPIPVQTFVKHAARLNLNLENKMSLNKYFVENH